MRKFWIQLILAFTLILGGMQWSAIRAQPDLIGTEVRDLVSSGLYHQ